MHGGRRRHRRSQRGCSDDLRQGDRLPQRTAKRSRCL